MEETFPRSDLDSVLGSNTYYVVEEYQLIFLYRSKE